MNPRLASILIVLAGLAANPGEATEVSCADRVVLPNLALRYCSNHCYRSDTEVLSYFGLAKALNAYLGEKPSIGNRKLEIEAQPVSGNAGPAICLTRSPAAFHLEFRYGYSDSWGCEGISGLRDFVRIADYLGSKTWQSFCYDYQKVSCGAALHSFHQVLDREVGEPDLSFFEGRRIVVFELDDLQIVYEGSRLFYELAGHRLDLEPEDPLPVKIGERYIFGSKGAIHVYENSAEILRIDWTYQSDFGPFRARAFRSWVNLGYPERPRLSYSAEENRFHEIAAGASSWDGSFGDCGRVYSVPSR